MTKLFFVFWPSFLIAGIAEIAFFAVINPQELYLLGQPINLSPLATYSIGFFAFWAVCAASSYTTCFFQRSGRDINEETIHHTAPTA